VRLSFEENVSSKVGVRFDQPIPGGIDLGGSCEVDHGFFCSGEFLPPVVPFYLLIYSSYTVFFLPFLAIFCDHLLMFLCISS
jgi:hypothetical protein